MQRSMFAGVSGLNTHQERMDVIGNNISNVNTTGFKKGRATFQEMLSQQLRAASAPTDDRGGTNPQEVGLGVTVGSIDTIMEQGSLEATGNNTDLALEGEGFFVFEAGEENVFSRAGTLSFDEEGNLVSSTTGRRIQGWMAENGEIEVSPADLDSISVPSAMEADATESVSIAGNLDAEAGDGEQWEINATVYNSQGMEHNVTMVVEKDDHNTWDIEELTVDEEEIDDLEDYQLIFDESGELEGEDEEDKTAAFEFAPETLEDEQEITIDFSEITQYAGETTAYASSVDGYRAGDLQSVAVDEEGLVSGSYDNGQDQTVAQLAVAGFENPAGLSRIGDTFFTPTANSGTAHIGEAGADGRGTIAPGTIEMSNVDLAEEFTDMIVTQRGFQANSRTISTTDEILQEVVNIRR